VQSLRRRVWVTRFFENSAPDAFDEHFFNGLLGKVCDDRRKRDEAQGARSAATET